MINVNIPKPEEQEEVQTFPNIGPIGRSPQPESPEIEIPQGISSDEAQYSEIQTPESESLFKSFKDAIRAAYHTSFEYSAFRYTDIMRYRKLDDEAGIQATVSVQRAKDEFGIEVDRPITYGEAMMRIEMRNQREEALSNIENQFGFDRPILSLATFLTMGYYYAWTPTSLTLTAAMTKLAGPIGMGGTMFARSIMGMRAFSMLRRQTQAAKAARAAKTTGDALLKLEKKSPFKEALKQASPLAAANAAEEIGIDILDRAAVGDQYGLGTAIALGVSAPFAFGSMAAYLKSLKMNKKPKQIAQAHDALEDVSGSTQVIEKTEVIEAPIQTRQELQERLEARKLEIKKSEEIKIEEEKRVALEKIEEKKQKESLKATQEKIKEFNRKEKERKRAEKETIEKNEKLIKKHDRYLKSARAKLSAYKTKKANAENRERQKKAREEKAALEKENKRIEREQKKKEREAKAERERLEAEKAREEKKAKAQAKKLKEAQEKVKKADQVLITQREGFKEAGKGYTVEGTKDYLKTVKMDKRLRLRMLDFMEGKLDQAGVLKLKAGWLKLLQQSEKFRNKKMAEISRINELRKNLGDVHGDYLKKLNKELRPIEEHINQQLFIARLIDRSLDKYKDDGVKQKGIYTPEEKKFMDRSKKVVDYIERLIEKKPLKGIKSEDADIQQFVRRMNTLEKKVPGIAKRLKEISGATHSLGFKNQDLKKLVPILDESLDNNAFNKMLREKLRDLRHAKKKITPDNFLSVSEKELNDFFRDTERPAPTIQPSASDAKVAKKDIIGADVGAGKVAQISKDINKVIKELIDCKKGIVKETEKST